VVARQLYAPFGATRWVSGTLPTDLKFTGQRNDSTIGLYFYNARYYDPSLARFVQADTVVPNPSDPQSLNRYVYTRNNPLKYVDPSGHWYYDPGLDALVHTGVDYNEWPENLFYTPPSPKIFIPNQRACAALANTSSPCSTDVIGEPIRSIATFGFAVGWEPLDWALTFEAWSQGDFHVLDLLGLLPFLSAQMDDVGDVLHFADRAGADEVAFNNGWRTADGRFASPLGPGRAGAAAEEAVWNAVEQKPGWQVIEGRVYVRNAAGDVRVYDGAAIGPSGRPIGLEVKSGTGAKTPTQRAFDAGVNTRTPAEGIGEYSGLTIYRALEIRVD
jgi:RHS repeat-associated protein